MTRKSLPITFYLFLVFVSGAVVGALGYRTSNPPTARTVSAPAPPGDWRKQYMEESKARLDLTDDQVGKLKTIMDDTEARFREARERENQEIRQIRDEHITQVRMLLTPEQLPKYEKLHAEREARSKQQNQKKQ
jgi:Spy/CpxP family protein refolding chaperone